MVRQLKLSSMLYTLIEHTLLANDSAVISELYFNMEQRYKKSKIFEKGSNDELKQTIHRYGGALMNAMKLFFISFKHFHSAHEFTIKD